MMSSTHFERLNVIPFADFSVQLGPYIFLLWEGDVRLKVDYIPKLKGSNYSETDITINCCVCLNINFRKNPQTGDKESSD